jgi:hypothetical protein
MWLAEKRELAIHLKDDYNRVPEQMLQELEKAGIEQAPPTA